MKTISLVRDTLLPKLANAFFDFVLPRRIALIAESSLDGEFADTSSRAHRDKHGANSLRRFDGQINQRRPFARLKNRRCLSICPRQEEDLVSPRFL